MLGVMNAADHWWAFALRGVAAVIFGILAFVWPGVTLAVLILFWGAYALVDGILALVAAFRTGQDHRWWLMALGGVASLIFGVILLIAPGAGALALIWLIAAYAIIFGVLLLALAFRLRGLSQRAR